MRWAGNVALTRYEMCKKFWPENLKGRDHVEDVGIYGWIILEWIVGK
jgi:hypothetical protein